MAGKNTKSAKRPEPSVSIRASKAIQLRLKVYSAQIDRDMREVADEALEEYLRKKSA